MNKILSGFALSVFLAAPAMAADLPARMPVKAPVAPIATVYSWTGCYIGGHVGWAWGQKRVFDAAGEIVDFKHDVDGFLAGGQIGCNLWQADRWVFGIEGQAAWADIDGEASRTLISTAPPIALVIPGTTVFHTKADIIGSIAARFGYAFGASGQTLLFVKGGGAFIHERFRVTTAQTIFETDKELRWGWMVGGGFEHALGSNWSFKAEYNYNHFGRDSFDFCPVGGGTCVTADVKQHVHLVKVGLNWRFSGFGGPVVARY